MKTSEMNQKLIKIQMHGECINEALIELWDSLQELTPEREKQIKQEISTRTWAVIYLTQALRHPGFAVNNPSFNKVMAQAAFLDYEVTNEGDEVQ
jgi:hypothetical protein